MMGRDRSETPRRRAAGEVLEDLQRRQPFPLTALVELTRKCRLRCRHCYVDLDGHPGLDRPTIIRVLDDLARSGTLLLTLTGGEITLRPDWLDIAREAKRRAFALRLKTNALSLTVSEIAAIAELGVVAVDISVYGPSGDVHDAVTGVSGSFDKAVAAAKALSDAEVRVVWTSPVLRRNEEHVDALLDLAQRLCCEVSFDPRLCPSLDSKRDVSEERPSEEGLAQAMRALDDRGLLPEPDCRAEQDVGAGCMKAPNSLYIRADGEVWRCPTLSVSFGSVLDQSIDQIWAHSPERTRLTDSARAEPPECRACDVRASCRRCLANSWLEHGRLDRAAAIDCAAARVLSAWALAPRPTGCDTADCAAGLGEEPPLRCEPTGL
jgi:radical SAM protein with 4Fe4S-binding SPASM domain